MVKKYLVKSQQHKNAIANSYGERFYLFKALDGRCVLQFWRQSVLDTFYSNAGQKPAEGWFLSKWVYKFLPAKNLCTYQDIFFHST